MLYLFSNVLNCDLSVYIFQIYYAIKIQNIFRKWSLRHVRTPKWKYILKLLTINIDTEHINLLTRHFWIRKEWLIEPDSWIFTLEHSQQDLHEIVSDCEKSQTVR